MFDVITNNPFRILGVYSNCKQADIVRNFSRIKAFVNVGKEVHFPSDMDVILPRIERSIDSAQNAVSAINLPIDKLNYALFWFCQANDDDSAGLECLQNGDIESALSHFTNNDSYSSLINAAILFLVRGDIENAVNAYGTLIHNDQNRLQFCHAICDETVESSELELSHRILDELIREVGAKKIFPLISNKDDYSFVRESAIREPVAIINSEISKAKKVSSTDAVNSLSAGKTLISSTSNALSDLKSVVGTDDASYQSIVDSLAKQILQCGINYYNNSSDYNRAQQALELQKYALDLAQGKLIKERCQKNYDILLKAIDELPPESISHEVSSIQEAIKEFVAKPDKIKYSLSLVRNCWEYLKKIESTLGKKNTYYLKYATLVANNALHNVIEEVNYSQSQLSDDNIERITMSRMSEKRSSVFNDPFAPTTFGNLYTRTSLLDSEDFIRRTVHFELLSDYREVLSQAWLVIKHLDKLSFEESFYKERFIPNKNTLRKLCKQVGADMKHDTYSYLEFHSFDDNFDFDEPFGKVQGILCGLLWLAFIIVPIILVITGREDGSIVGAVVGGLIGGGIGGGIAAGLFSYVIIIVANVGIALINSVIWIFNQFTRNV